MKKHGPNLKLKSVPCLPVMLVPFIVVVLLLLAVPVFGQQTETICGIRYAVPPNRPPIVDTVGKRTVTDSIPCLRTSGGSAITDLRNRLYLRDDSLRRRPARVDTILVPVVVADTVYLPVPPDSVPTTPQDTLPPVVVPPDSVPGVRMIQDTVIHGDFRVPKFGEAQFGRNVVVEGGSVLVEDAVLHMRPGSSLKLRGCPMDGYVGGGMQYDSGLARDCGVWVWGMGRLDWQGTPVTAWNHTGQASDWRLTDEYYITPTAPGDFAPRRWTPGQPVPQVDPALPAAEVVNASRDIVISGTGHIHIHSTQPQTISYVRLDSLGISNRASQGPVLGRYALHMHMMGDAAQNTVIQGVVSTNARGRVFVVHASHGVTLKDVVCLHSYAECNWWDFGVGHDTNHLLIDGMLACGAYLPDAIGGTQDNAKVISLPAGTDLEIRNSVACGAQGGLGATGFDWPEPTAIFGANPKLVWRFLNNIAHNNRGQGLRFWTNNQDAHINTDFVSYHNSHGCVENGAYATATQYLRFVCFNDGYQFGNGEQETAAWLNNASGAESSAGPGRLADCRIKSKEGPAIQVGHRQLPSIVPLRVERCVLIPAPGKPKVYVGDGVNPFKAEFYEVELTPAEIQIVASPGNEGSVITIDKDGAGPLKPCIVTFVNQQKKLSGC